MHRSRGHLRHEDTRFLVASGLALLIGAALLTAWAPPAWTVSLLLASAAVVGLAEIRRHFRRTQVEHERLLEAIQALTSLQARLPLRRSLPPLSGWSASPQLAATLLDLVAERRPAVVVELGSGVSTLVLGYALETAGTGRLLSLDHDGSFAARTRLEVERHGLTGCVEVLDAPLVEQQEGRWYDLATLHAVLAGRRIDLVVVDGPPRNTGPNARYPAFPLLEPYLSPHAALVVDDAARSEMERAVQAWASAGGFEVERVAAPKGIAVLRR